MSIVYNIARLLCFVYKLCICNHYIRVLCYLATKVFIGKVMLVAMNIRWMSYCNTVYRLVSSQGFTYCKYIEKVATHLSNTDDEFEALAYR